MTRPGKFTEPKARPEGWQPPAHAITAFESKHKVRAYTRCNRCGRPRAVYRKFGVCRICLRELAHQGAVPGMTKSSW